MTTEIYTDILDKSEGMYVTERLEFGTASQEETLEKVKNNAGDRNLPSINHLSERTHPNQLHGLSVHQLKQIAQQIRENICNLKLSIKQRSTFLNIGRANQQR